MLVISLLGGLALELEGERLDPPARRSGQALLGYLALNPGLHARGSLASLMWPDVLDSSARASLRSALSSVRRSLGAAGDAYLTTRRDAIGLADDADLSVDVREFRALVARGQLEPAAAIGRGILLQGLEADWVEDARRDHLDRVADVLAELAAAAEESGDLRAAIRHTREQLALDPLAEAPARELMRRLAAAGDKAAALSAYARLADAFRAQLRSAPSSQTRQLAARIRAEVDEDVRAPWTPLPPPPALRIHEPSPPVGRTRELAELAATMDRARAGRGQVALVEGEPGIGKTALMARLAAAVAADASVLLGRCTRDAATPLAPFVEALRGYAAGTPPARLAADLPPAASQLAALVPELAELPLAAGAGVPELPLSESGRLARAIAETLRAASARHPLLLVIEDLHDADSATARAVSHLASELATAKLMLVVTHRAAATGAVESTLRQLRGLPYACSIELAALDAAEVGELVAAVTGQAPSPDEAAAIRRRGGGNPLFVEEIARAESAGASAAGVPERIGDLILDELARLAPATRRVLATASVLGDEFELAPLVRVAATTADRCLDALDEAVAATTLRELPHGVGRFQFRHPLVRETLYAGLTATRRAHVHLRTAEVLEELAPAGDPSAGRAVAEHLARARELAPRSKLAAATLRAGRAAEAALLHEDAAVLYRRAADLAGADPRARCELLIATGRASRRAGEPEAARAAYAVAARLAAELEAGELLAEAALGACASPDFTRQQGVDELGVTLLEQALDATPHATAALRAQLLAQLAAAQRLGGQPARVTALAEQAEELARDSGDPRALSAALDAAHAIRRGSGDPVERLALADELLELARADGDSERLALARVRRSGDLFELGDFAAVRRERSELTKLALELRQPAYLWFTKLWEATEAIFLGDAGAESLSARAYEAGRVAFGEAAELEFGAQAFWLRLEEGRLAERDPAVDARLARYAALPAVRCAFARVHAEEGRLDAAAAGLRQLVCGELSELMREPGWPLCAAVLAEVCGRVGDSEAAGVLRSALEPAAGRWATSAYGSVCLGPLSGSLALVCAAAGDGEAAARHRAAALEACAAVGAAPAAARLRRELERLASARPAAQPAATSGL